MDGGQVKVEVNDPEANILVMRNEANLNYDQRIYLKFQEKNNNNTTGLFM